MKQRPRPVACPLAETPVEGLHQLLQRELDLPESRKIKRFINHPVEAGMME